MLATPVRMPDVVTHIYHPEGVFLGNMCDLASGDAERVLQRFRSTGQRLKASYLHRRLETEAWLIRERSRLLGRTRRERPIYFFLGDFADGKDPSRPCSLVMPLAVLPKEVLTFTLPDSMASFPIGTHEEHRCERQPHHGKVFSLDEITRLISQIGMPNENWTADRHGPIDRFVEVQVWDDRPIMDFLGASPERP